MKPYLNLHLGPLFINLGWYPSEGPVLLRLVALEVLTSVVMILEIQVARLCFLTGFEKRSFSESRDSEL